MNIHIIHTYKQAITLMSMLLISTTISAMRLNKETNKFVKDKNAQALFKAIEENNTPEAIQYASLCSPYINELYNPQDKSFWTPLRTAVDKTNNIDILKILLENGAKIDQKDISKFQTTPLLAALAKGNQLTIAYLLNNGASTIYSKEYLEKMLCTAMRGGCEEAVFYLIKKRHAEIISLQSIDAYDLLNITISHGSSTTLSYLLYRETYRQDLVSKLPYTIMRIANTNTINVQKSLLNGLDYKQRASLENKIIYLEKMIPFLIKRSIGAEYEYKSLLAAIDKKYNNKQLTSAAHEAVYSTLQADEPDLSNLFLARPLDSQQENFEYIEKYTKHYEKLLAQDQEEIEQQSLAQNLAQEITYRDNDNAIGRLSKVDNPEVCAAEERAHNRVMRRKNNTSHHATAAPY